MPWMARCSASRTNAAVSPGASSDSRAGCRVLSLVADWDMPRSYVRIPPRPRVRAFRDHYGGRVPVEPPPTIWEFPGPSRFHPEDDLVATGADLEPGTVLAAYRLGIFPMPLGDRPLPMAWFCPVRRGVVRPRDLHVSRSLARSMRRFEIRVDT